MKTRRIAVHLHQWLSEGHVAKVAALRLNDGESRKAAPGVPGRNLKLQQETNVIPTTQSLAVARATQWGRTWKKM
jgi:hypothetical protein